MTKTRPFLSMCYGDPSATEVPPCCETATNKLTFSTTSVLLLLNMPLSLSRATIFRRQKNPRRVYRPKIAGILFVCNEPEGKYYTVPRLRMAGSRTRRQTDIQTDRQTGNFIKFKIVQSMMFCNYNECHSIAIQGKGDLCFASELTLAIPFTPLALGRGKRPPLGHPAPPWGAGWPSGLGR